jgi:hypothetical protein
MYNEANHETHIKTNDDGCPFFASSSANATKGRQRTSASSHGDGRDPRGWNGENRNLEGKATTDYTD